MKRLILLLTICTLINGCGLFRKKTTIKQSALVEQKSDVKESESEKAKLNVQQSQNTITLTTDQGRIKTTVKGREIEITSTGIKCKDCEVEQREDKDLKKQTDSIALVNSNLEYAKDADRRVRESLKDETKDSNVVTEPSIKGMIWGAVALILVVSFLFWYFGVKRRKSPPKNQ
ncbi:hypothetical protein KO02_12165 [Sphingobacterium sp. ML3W]|uniref:hypothetical protein n=1 Tax=Sphingobacterium sp. ML3W TaxID=1538644 RepID=UPI0004F6AC68|nr:hypothetical protein [Sphingobacterium sp. ML3W]AIM37362.1 hypothetical protein KO02_12165 [Sphingobacterium sp. ML3W]